MRALRGDMLQGVLMERIATDYAGELHSQGPNPYSQYLDVRRDGAFWFIQTLTEAAGFEIIEPLASPKFTGFKIERLNMNVSISEKKQSHMSMSDMVSRFYFGQGERVTRLRFITPTAFKSGGEYVFYPDLKLFFGSLMRKHASICEGREEDDGETLNALLENVKIASYSLRSAYSKIGNARLPAFCGAVTLKLSGASSLVNYANFLLRFGEYSGVGIKCSMGMGALRVLGSASRGKEAVTDG
jgi:CRISPR-associated endoribonuclease Cas6